MATSTHFQDQQRRFANDIERKIVGPMPPEEFLNQFFPAPLNTETQLRDELEEQAKRGKGDPYDKIKFAGVPNSPKKEEAVYRGLRLDDRCAIANPINDMDVREGPSNVLDATHIVTASSINIYLRPAESAKPTKRKAKTDSDVPRSSKVLRSGNKYLVL